jgi:uncharacterized protein (TIGR02996 family)
MTGDDCFLQALRERHQDEYLWLVYADYLEEQGDPRASFLHRGGSLPPPWKWLVVGEGLVRQLQREVGHAHALFGKQVLALAHRNSCEDIMFLVEGQLLAVVRLTWNDSPPTDPRRPATTFFPCWEKWVEQCGN